MNKLGLFLGLCGLMGLALGQTINSGNVVLGGSPPSDLRADQFEDNNVAYLFTEHLNHTVPRDVTVDVVSPGLYDAESDLGTFTLLAGTQVNVYLLHSDPIGNGPRDYYGSITFPFPILAVIARGRRLRLSDDELGVPTTQYSQSDNYRGYELDTQDVEQFEVLSDGVTLRFYARTTDVVDELRIITAIPEPGTLTVLGAGLMSLMAVRARRRQR